MGPLERDQMPVPAHQGVRRHDRRDLVQHPPPEEVGLRRQSPTLVIGKAELPLLALSLEDSFLLDEERGDSGVVPVDDARGGQQEDL